LDSNSFLNFTEETSPQITQMTQIRKIMKALIGVICVHLWLSISVAAQAPEILKVDPPSWWTRSTVNPVRLMIHGRNLQDARVEVQGLRIINTKISESGTRLN